MNKNNFRFDFNEDTFGNFKVIFLENEISIFDIILILFIFQITKFHLENVGKFTGSIQSGAFKESKISLVEFIMEDSELQSDKNWIEAGAFEESAIKIIKLGKNFCI